MTRALRILLALFAVSTLCVGAAFAFTPQRIAADFAVASVGIAGLGTLRADLGGCFAVLGLFTLAGLRAGQARWLVVPLTFTAAFLGLRVMHLAVDGASEAGLRSTLVELALVALLFVGRRVLLARERS